MIFTARESRDKCCFLFISQLELRKPTHVVGDSLFLHELIDHFLSNDLKRVLFIVKMWGAASANMLKMWALVKTSWDLSDLFRFVDAWDVDRGIRCFGPRPRRPRVSYWVVKRVAGKGPSDRVHPFGMMIKSAHLHQLIGQFNSSTVGSFFHTSSYWGTCILEHHNSCECSLNDLLDARISIGPSAISPVQSWWVASEFLTQVLPTKSRDFPRRSWRCYGQIGQMRSFISGISPGTGSFNQFQQFLHLESFAQRKERTSTRNLSYEKPSEWARKPTRANLAMKQKSMKCRGFRSPCWNLVEVKLVQVELSSLAWKSGKTENL